MLPAETISIRSIFREGALGLTVFASLAFALALLLVACPIVGFAWPLFGQPGLLDWSRWAIILSVHLSLGLIVVAYGALAGSLSLVSERWNVTSRLLEAIVAAAAKLRPELRLLTIETTLGATDAASIREGLLAGVAEITTQLRVPAMRPVVRWIGAQCVRATLSTLEARTTADGAVQFPSLTAAVGRKVERALTASVWKGFALCLVLLLSLDVAIVVAGWYFDGAAGSPS